MKKHRMYQFPLQLPRIAALIESIPQDEPSLMMRDMRAGLVELLAHRKAEVAGPLIQNMIWFLPFKPSLRAAISAASACKHQKN